MVSDLDAATKSVLDKGSRNVEILKQGQYSPLRVDQQVAIVYLGSKGLLTKIPVNKVREFESSYLDYLETNHKETLNQLAAGKYESKLTDVLEEVAAELIAGMS